MSFLLNTTSSKVYDILKQYGLPFPCKKINSHVEAKLSKINSSIMNGIGIRSIIQ